MKKVIVQYVYGGKVDKRDNEAGILFPNGKVFVAGNSEIGLYNAIISDKQGVVTVDLDNGGEEYMRHDPEVLIDLLAEI
ncbi:hypothetical protein LCM23_17180 [Cytobacillus kochii]|uniref:hypothetical protein n=1 Tax=Cytobacillus kochii TaxID=859143 RepID=UPI001CD39E35|nr:hypothetical protein [Cytobacillus kochii]MCA1027830.1 hypothetical protein [Cytobacillus kochii]